MNFKQILNEKLRGLFSSKKFIIAMIAGSLVSVISTYVAITRSFTPFGTPPKLVMSLLIIDLIFLLMLVTSISKRFIGFFAEKKKSGYRLQSRIILMFSLVFSIPTIIISSFSYLFFSYGIESWFNDKVSNALEESVIVAESYLGEHKEAIKVEAIKMANIISEAGLILMQDQEKFNEFLDIEASVRSLTEVIIFKPNKVIAQNSLSFSLAFSNLPVDQMKEADSGDVILLFDPTIDKVRALVKLKNFFNTYLIVGRPIDQQVLYHVKKTHGEVSEYRQLKTEISDLQIRFAIIFVIISLILMTIAISMGIIFTGVITKPINDLVYATGKIQTGDFSFRVVEGPENDEIAILAKAFNLMIERLNQQRNDLVQANEQIDARRHFSETILSGVSAGIIVLETNGKIAMINPSATRFLNLEASSLIGAEFEQYFPRMKEFLREVMEDPKISVHKETSLTVNGKQFFLLVRIVAESFADNVTGYIVSFDDVTELIIAQRHAAWSDVARKVAHEIKNPLTPIQLAAERIKRKYGQFIPDADQETFGRYVDTIKRHVSDIGKMVEEFVEFARMPSPVIIHQDLMALVNNVVFSRQCLQNNILYEVKSDFEKINLPFDKSQIGRLLTNLFKNSEESCQEKFTLIKKNSNNFDELAKITIEITDNNQYITLVVSDNGAGFGQSLFPDLAKPYVTTKSDGNGLGLAIVKKIVNDHAGNIEFANLEVGAEVRVHLPKK